jgi:hypothetical protein
MLCHLLGHALKNDWEKRMFRFKTNLFGIDATFIKLRPDLYV